MPINWVDSKVAPPPTDRKILAAWKAPEEWKEDWLISLGEHALGSWWRLDRGYEMDGPPDYWSLLNPPGDQDGTV